jgi:hypothetical protein
MAALSLGFTPTSTSGSSIGARPEISDGKRLTDRPTWRSNAN